jgi:hypothetical protein
MYELMDILDSDQDSNQDSDLSDLSDLDTDLSDLDTDSDTIQDTDQDSDNKAINPKRNASTQIARPHNGHSSLKRQRDVTKNAIVRIERCDFHGGHLELTIYASNPNSAKDTCLH